MSIQPVVRVSRFVSQQVWAIRESTLDVIVEMFRMRASGIELSREEVQARIGAGPRHGEGSVLGSVGLLPLHGVISPRANVMTDISGGTSLDMWIHELRQLRDNPAVSSIVIDAHTPGGSVFGVQEVFEEIFAARSIKPIIGQVNPECGSAGLWILAGCSEIRCMPSGEIGSLGAYMIHEDWSQANERIGVKPTYIKYGRYKTEGNPDEPLSDEALVYLQERVDVMGEMFVKAVAKGRKVPVAKVKGEFGQGRMLSSTDALAVGMIDKIATLDETMSRLTGQRRTTSGSRAATIPSESIGASEGPAGIVAGQPDDVTSAADSNRDDPDPSADAATEFAPTAAEIDAANIAAVLSGD
jgi:signal peptide peptidase SppA